MKQFLYTVNQAVHSLIVLVIFAGIGSIPTMLMAQQQSQENISGQVRDAETGKILPGATVRIEGVNLDRSENMSITSVANKEGMYRFKVPSGRYDLIIGGEGYQQKRMNVELSAGQEKRLDVMLEPMNLNYAYQVETMELPPQMVPEISGIDFTSRGTLVVTNRRGEVWMQDRAKKGWHRFAYGLYEPFGVVADMPGGNIYVIQRPEITKLSDTDGDGRADRYETVNDSWGITGNYHEFSYGLARDSGGNLYGGLGMVSAGDFPWIRGELKPKRVIPWRGEGKVPDGHRSVVPYQGWSFRVTPKGEFEGISTGFRQPLGLGVSRQDELFVTDVSGSWVPTSVLYHVQKGNFYGHPGGLKWDSTFDAGKVTVDQLKDMRTPPAVYLPRGPMGISPGQPAWDTTEGGFGPFAEQMFIGDVSRNLMRVDLEKVAGEYQGAAFPFLRDQGLRQGSMHHAFGPDGNLYLAQTVRGWMPTGGGEGIQRITWTGEQPVEILTMRLTEDGFRLNFTEPMKPEELSHTGNYSIVRFQYNYHMLDGSLRVSEVEVPVEKAVPSEEGTSVELELLELHPGYIYELQMERLESKDGKPIINPTAYYTANRLLSGETHIEETELIASEKQNREKPDVDSGRQIYQMYCRVCHQADGRGSSQVGTPDFTGTEGPLTQSNKKLAETISQGKGDNMPSFGNVISEKEIQSLILFLREEFAQH